MGRIQVNKYTTADGEERRNLQLVADHIMTAKSTRPNAGRKKSDSQPTSTGPVEYYQRGGSEDVLFNDEVPF